jgi:hypothetical protein
MTEQKPAHRPEDEKLTGKEFFDLTELWHYFFRRKGEHAKGDFNLRAMHFVNKFSIIIFLAGVIYMIFKFWI